MFRTAILALALACPAMAQESDAERRQLSDALTQADVDTLGGCQARVEGMGRLVDHFQDWLQQEGYSQQLAGIRKAHETGRDLGVRMEELRTLLGSEAGGFDFGASEAARTAMAATFQRLPGESDRDAYSRWHKETTLPDGCRDAMKRARSRVEVKGLAWEE